VTAYATRQDLYKFGLPRGALANPARLVASMSAANSTIELLEHGFETGDAITFRIADGGSLSAPLVAGTTYYAIKLNDSDFQVSATPTGGPITLTTDSVSIFVTADLPIDDLLEAYSRFADDLLPAHAVPLQAPYPVTVVRIVCELTAKKAQILSGLKSESMEEAELAAMAQLKRFGAGLPIRQAQPNNIPTNLAVTSAIGQPRIGVIEPLNGGRITDNGGFNQ
jgi:hypothetical protein